MKYFRLLLFFIVAFVLLLSCSTSKKLETIQPVPSDNVPMVYETKTSFLAIPVSITLKDIEKQTNKNIKGLVYEDTNLEDDKIMLKVWKTKDIVLTEKNGVIISEIPLKIWAKVKYGTDFLGLNDTREVAMNGVLVLKSKANLTNWKLYTTTTLLEVKWNESPAINVAGKSIPITYLVNPAIKIFSKKIEKAIDQSIAESCDFKPYVLQALQEMSKPFLTSATYETWLALQPLELYVTDAELKNGEIITNMGLKCNMKTMIGQVPVTKFDASQLVLKPVTKIPDAFSVYVAAVSTYESASRIISKNFKGQTFGEGKKQVTVENVSVWEKDSKLIIALSTTGAINGTIYLSGEPKFDAATNTIFFANLDYVLQTKNVLLKSANWLMKGLILNKIKENCIYSIQSNLEEGKANMQPYLNNYEPMKGVLVNGTMEDFVFEKMELTNKAFVAFISTKGKIKVAIDGLE